MRLVSCGEIQACAKSVSRGKCFVRKPGNAASTPARVPAGPASPPSAIRADFLRASSLGSARRPPAVSSYTDVVLTVVVSVGVEARVQQHVPGEAPVQPTRYNPSLQSSHLQHVPGEAPVQPTRYNPLQQLQHLLHVPAKEP